MFVHNIFVHIDPPPPNQQNEGFPLEFLLRRASNRIANTQPKLRTNPPKIANKQNYEQTGVSDKIGSKARDFNKSGICNGNQIDFRDFL